MVMIEQPAVVLVWLPVAMEDPLTTLTVPGEVEEPSPQSMLAVNWLGSVAAASVMVATCPLNWTLAVAVMVLPLKFTGGGFPVTVPDPIAGVLVNISGAVTGGVMTVPV